MKKYVGAFMSADTCWRYDVIILARRLKLIPFALETTCIQTHVHPPPNAWEWIKMWIRCDIKATLCGIVTVALGAAGAMLQSNAAWSIGNGEQD